MVAEQRRRRRREEDEEEEEEKKEEEEEEDDFFGFRVIGDYCHLPVQLPGCIKEALLLPVCLRKRLASVLAHC